jgi:hypothetical protein
MEWLKQEDTWRVDEEKLKKVGLHLLEPRRNV